MLIFIIILSVVCFLYLLEEVRSQKKILKQLRGNINAENELIRGFIFSSEVLKSDLEKYKEIQILKPINYRKERFGQLEYIISDKMRYWEWLEERDPISPDLGLEFEDPVSKKMDELLRAHISKILEGTLSNPKLTKSTYFSDHYVEWFKKAEPSSYYSVLGWMLPDIEETLASNRIEESEEFKALKESVYSNVDIAELIPNLEERAKSELGKKS